MSASASHEGSILLKTRLPTFLWDAVVLDNLKTREKSTMMGRQSAPANSLNRFRLDDHVPADHLLRRLDAVLPFDRVRTALAEYDSHTGRPCIHPELLLRMLLLGYVYGLRSERRLCREVHLNWAYHWFCRLGMQGRVPPHSTLSKNRYGRFRESDIYRVLFEEVVNQCRQAGLVPGEDFAVDGSLIGGNAGRDRRVETVEALRKTDTRPVREYLIVVDASHPIPDGDAKYLSPTDPAAAWNTKEGRGKFGYFSNYLVDTDQAVIVEVEATPARLAQEILATKAMLGRVEQTHGLRPERLAADKAYVQAPSWAGSPNGRSRFTSPSWIGSNRPQDCCPGRRSPSMPKRTVSFARKVKSSNTVPLERQPVFICTGPQPATVKLAPFDSNARAARSVLFLCRLTKRYDKKSWHCKAQMPFSSRAERGKKSRCCSRTGNSTLDSAG
ncbi:MAG: transposase [Acidobacteriaceae bacterium]|nr:transposase [Acidobacteriaceae bacterium]